MIRPQPCSLITFHAALVHLYAPKTCTLKIMFQSSSFIFWNDTSLKIPALFSKISTLPKLSVAVLMILSPNSTESQLATATPPFAFISLTTLSAALELLPCPLKEPPKSFTTTLAPLLPKKSAYSLPIPLPAPVTTTTFPSNLSVISIIIMAMTSFFILQNQVKYQKNLIIPNKRRQNSGKSSLLKITKITTATKNQKANLIFREFSSSFLFSPFTKISAFFNFSSQPSYIELVPAKFQEVLSTPILMLDMSPRDQCSISRV